MFSQTIKKSVHTILIQLLPNRQHQPPLLPILPLPITLRQMIPPTNELHPLRNLKVLLCKLPELGLQIQQFRLEVEDVLHIEPAKASEDGELSPLAHDGRYLGVAFQRHGGQCKREVDV